MSLMRPLTDMREQLNKAFYELSEDFSFPMSLRREWPFQEKGFRNWFPTIELRDSEKELLLRAEVPGMKPEEINVEITETSVIINGEASEERNEGKGALYHSEFRYGSFYRRISLPVPVKTDGAVADYKNGVLELHLPKKVTSQTKRLTINSK